MIPQITFFSLVHSCTNVHTGVYACETFIAKYEKDENRYYYQCAPLTILLDVKVYY